MRHVLRLKLLFWIIGAALFLFHPIAVAASAAIDQRLYSELLKFPTDRKIISVDGVPSLKIFLSEGQSINSFCRSVRYFDRNFYFYRRQIALLNRLEPLAVVGATDNLSTEVEYIYVPLNFSISPEILPRRIENISQLPQYILIDIGQQCLGLYEYGRLTHQFAISSGKNGTPARKFVILSKEKDHYSTKYENAWMPYSLRLFGDYFLHGGILPSYAASHGCVRLMYYDAIFVWNWARVGTPGQVINDSTLNPEEEISDDEEDEPEIRNESEIKTLY